MSLGYRRIFTNAMAKSVCIVGAGPSGLVAAKTLLHNAFKGEEYSVKVFDAKDGIGGLWPTARDDTSRQVHPLMLTNQSKHTVAFSDLAWDETEAQFPPAYKVGQYLQRYLERFLLGNPRFELHLNSRVRRAERRGQGWTVSIEGKAAQTSHEFDCLLVASGFFGKPLMPECLSDGPFDVPVVHSSHYRNLDGLLGTGRSGGGKILVVGGQMSGVEIAGTIASHLSSAANAPETSDIVDIDKYTVHHLVQRPTWVFPLFTSPEPSFTAAPFLPVDLGFYNRSNRPSPFHNQQGHITEESAKRSHGLFETVLGTDQSEFHPALQVGDAARSQPPYLAMSEWYCDFVRSGLITVSNGKIESLNGQTAKVSNGGGEVNDIAAVVVATGFDPSPCLDYLPDDVLESIHHLRQSIDQPVALAFHGTHHPSVPGLGFVGFYRSPYWGVMQMQSRFLTTLWSDSKGSGSAQKVFADEVNNDDCIQSTLKLRGDPRRSQFPAGDYLWIMQEFAEALSIDVTPPPGNNGPRLSYNNLPMDILTPARYVMSNDDVQCKDDAEQAIRATSRVTDDGLGSTRFVARGVFRSLLGTWKLERDLVSKRPSHPSGHFSGTARFLLREQTTDGCECTSGPDATPATDDGYEFLYIEEGDFKTDQGLVFKATRRYVWRYDDGRDVLSVWFVKPDDLKRADYLFHEVEFEMPQNGRDKGWPAKAGHLCVDDFYDVKYNFAFQAVNLKKWNIEYAVKGPNKDYTIHGTYTR